MVARIVLLVAAAALIALGIGRTDAHRGCDDGRRAAFAVGAGQLPASLADGVAERLIDRCRGAEQLVDGTAALLRVHAIGAAGRLADAAVRREPRRRDSWIALWRVLDARGQHAAAQRARQRAAALDPLSFPAPPRSG